ncbi:hypothetical protein ACMA1D_00870 [Streptomyces sp. 796.1]|uniref:hypothetical protein n=1 Tax=Streptomyces sp. 796.1 TaxID=3163029 RepID=UPI0039C9853E
MGRFTKALAVLGAASAAFISFGSAPASAAAKDGAWMDVRPEFTKNCGHTTAILYANFWGQSCIVDNGKGYAQAVLILSNQTDTAVTSDNYAWSDAIYGSYSACPTRTITAGKQIACVSPTEFVGRGRALKLYHATYAGARVDYTSDYYYAMK